ncbi:MAG TPA: PASTA domain-containing protein [Gaiellaceae bacterium]|nr:PASTA domain-containing protein [Gaiellaceae bacterium]
MALPRLSLPPDERPDDADDEVTVDGWPVPSETLPPLRPARGRAATELRARPRPLSRPAPLAAGAAATALALLLGLGAAALWLLPERARRAPAAAGAAVPTVPRLTGLTFAAARTRLHARGLGARVRHAGSGGRPGLVLSQQPPPGARAAPRTKVLLVVSAPAAAAAPSRESRPATATVPAVVGVALRSAAARVRDAGLRATVSLVASSRPQGSVLVQDPDAGASVPRGSTVALEVAKAEPRPPKPQPKPQPPGRPKVIVPPLVGLDLDQARTRLGALGLRADVTQAASARPAGTVLAQSVVAGAQLRTGMTVALRVSSGRAGVVVPDVTGLDEASARSRLEAAGFAVSAVDVTAADPSEDGTVLDQSPTGDTRARRGATVTIEVGRL